MTRRCSVRPASWEERAELVLALLDEPRPISYVMGVSGWGRETTRKVLAFLREAGKIDSSGRGRWAVWSRIE